MASRKPEPGPEPNRRAASPAERILAAADKLFYQHGIRAVGVDAIADEAGVSKRTLYNHYPTKDDLIAAYLVARLAVKAGFVTEGAAMFDAIAPKITGRPDAEAFERDRRDLADPTSAVANARIKPASPKPKRSPFCS